MRKVLLGSLLVLVAATGAIADELDPTKPVPEPAGYWTGPMHSRTPATVEGGKVIDGDTLARLGKTETPVVIDVANLQRRPKGVPSKLPWSPVHVSIPGSTWMPGAGEGRTDAAFQAAFAKRLAELTGGDKTKPVVTFCHPHRWGSYNAAKRAAALGYTHVYWLRDGAEGWEEHHQAVATHEDADWKAAFSKLEPTSSEAD